MLSNPIFKLVIYSHWLWFTSYVTDNTHGTPQIGATSEVIQVKTSFHQGQFQDRFVLIMNCLVFSLPSSQSFSSQMNSHKLLLFCHLMTWPDSDTVGSLWKLQGFGAAWMHKKDDKPHVKHLCNLLYLWHKLTAEITWQMMHTWKEFFSFAFTSRVVEPRRNKSPTHHLRMWQVA